MNELKQLQHSIFLATFISSQLNCLLVWMEYKRKSQVNLRNVQFPEFLSYLIGDYLVIQFCLKETKWWNS